MELYEVDALFVIFDGISDLLRIYGLEFLENENRSSTSSDETVSMNTTERHCRGRKLYNAENTDMNDINKITLRDILSTLMDFIDHDEVSKEQDNNTMYL